MTEGWARAVLRRFGQFADQFAECFGRRVQRDAVSQYLEGLFNDSERKSMQAMLWTTERSGYALHPDG